MEDRLGDILAASGLIGQEDLQAALDVQSKSGVRLGEALVEMGLASHLEIARALAAQLGIPHLGPEQLLVDDRLVKLLPPGYCLANAAAPVRRPDGGLLLAMAEPLNVGILDHVREAAGEHVDRAVALEADVRAALASRLGRAEALEALGSCLKSSVDVEFLREVSAELEGAPEDPRVVQASDRILSLIIGYALEREADEVIADPRSNGVVFRFRIRGRLRDGLLLPSHSHASVQHALCALAGIERPVSSAGRGHFRALYLDRSVDVQVAMIRTGRGMRSVLRLLPGGEAVATLDDIGVPAKAQDFVYQALAANGAATLVTGLLPDGRRRALRACLSLVSVGECNVVSVEEWPGLGAVSGVARLDAELDPAGFAATLRTALQQDPDVLMISHLKEREATEIALEAALDGRTVLGALPAANPAEAMRRLLDAGVDRRLLANSLSAVLCHYALRRICPHCRTETQPSAMVHAEIARAMGREVAGPFYEGRGCDACMNTGFDGSVSVYGALRLNSRIRVALMRGLEGEELKAALTPDVYVSAAEAGLDRARAGQTTVEELALHLQAMEA